MKTKRILFAFLSVSLMAFMATSCKKYEDGPTFSLASKKGRVEGKWKVESAFTMTNGTQTDITADLKAELVSLELKDDGQMIIDFGSGTDESKWEFDDKKEHLIFIYSDTDREEWEIRRLKKKELWIRLYDGNDYTEVHFIQ